MMKHYTANEISNMTESGRKTRINFFIDNFYKEMLELADLGYNEVSMAVENKYSREISNFFKEKGFNVTKEDFRSSKYVSKIKISWE